MQLFYPSRSSGRASGIFFMPASALSQYINCANALGQALSSIRYCTRLDCFVFAPKLNQPECANSGDNN
ncbi:hypothetical protein CWB99_00085 [Pseudoalteromonas rubra]|uniref:Uncharacterized protein n=1 Tax=Pseudoalteromonas rubra TaxID=43658 RepID=A0A5S3WTZ5_9GAMM|nr:hypothetical protein CWC00_14550 [Pseudoalteromonas rubra]TMP33087.1 hypothetical protein CWB99_00085 [Pseudoalteromonas rubra]